jgi:hypothetical protein
MGSPIKREVAGEWIDVVGKDSGPIIGEEIAAPHLGGYIRAKITKATRDFFWETYDGSLGGSIEYEEEYDEWTCGCSINLEGIPKIKFHGQEEG